MNDIVYKILPAELWQHAEAAGQFGGAGIDIADGYIHLSAAHQVRKTAALYFGGIEGLVLVVIDAAKLGDALKWETSRDDALFPHLYGPLPITAVLRVEPMRLDANGVHIFSKDIV